MKLINGDSLEVLDQMIENGTKVEAIISDPPYGTIQGMQLQGSKHKVDWDKPINWSDFFNKAFKITNTVILFGQQPTWSELVVAGRKYYKEELVWIKNKSAQGFHADKMHLKFFENIGVFRSKPGTFNLKKNPKLIDPETMPLRAYAQSIMVDINIPRAHIHRAMGHRKLEFFLYFRGTLFGLPKREVWDDFCSKFDNFNHKTYDELLEMKKLDITLKTKLDANFSDTLRNVLVFDKDSGLHPTQKPVALMRYLVSTYTNRGDTVLDPFMGSGSTGEGAILEGRQFIGVELTEKYFEVAKNRLEKIAV